MSREDHLYHYEGILYPQYLKHGNVMQFIAPVAAHFCKGRGLDVGCSKWPFPGAQGVDLTLGGDAMKLPGEDWDYIFSSHCLEHLVDPVRAIEHWREKLREGGVLFLYLPHPDMAYWRPENCRKHLHLFHPAYVASMLRSLGFQSVINSERDMSWSFTVLGYKEDSQWIG